RVHGGARAESHRQAVLGAGRPVRQARQLGVVDREQDLLRLAVARAHVVLDDALAGAARLAAAGRRGLRNAVALLAGLERAVVAAARRVEALDLDRHLERVLV